MRVDSEEMQAHVTKTEELLAIVGPIQESIETHFNQLQVHVSKEHGVALASLKQHVEALMDERFQQVAALVDERSQQAGQSGRLAPSRQCLSSQEATPLTDRTGNALTPCSFAVSSRSSSMTSAFNWNYPVTGNSSTASVATSPLPETVDGPQSPAPCQVTSRIKASAWNHRTAGTSDDAFGAKLKLHNIDASTPTKWPNEQQENIGREQLTGRGQGICSPLHRCLAMVSFTSLVTGAASRCQCAAWLAVAKNRQHLRSRPPTPSPQRGPMLLCTKPTRAGGPFCSSHLGEKLPAQQHQTPQMIQPAPQQPTQRPVLPQQTDAAESAASTIADESTKGCTETRYVHI